MGIPEPLWVVGGHSPPPGGGPTPPPPDRLSCCPVPRPLALRPSTPPSPPPPRGPHRDQAPLHPEGEPLLRLPQVAGRSGRGGGGRQGWWGGGLRVMGSAVGQNWWSSQNEFFISLLPFIITNIFLYYFPFLLLFLLFTIIIIIITILLLQFIVSILLIPFYSYQFTCSILARFLFPSEWKHVHHLVQPSLPRSPLLWSGRPPATHSCPTCLMVCSRTPIVLAHCNFLTWGLIPTLYAIPI